MTLTQQGLAASEPNCGAKVSDNVAEWMQPLIVKIRLDIELFALKRSIKLAREEDLALLEDLVQQMSAACKKNDMAAVAELDITFHERLLEIAGEPDLVSVWLPIVTRMIMRYTRLRERAEIVQEHMEILNAVRARDLRRAVKALKRNVR